MKYRFLGTAAAEGIPAIFCNCALCEDVRERRNGYIEKDVRTRSQSIVNDDLLIDLPADTHGHCIDNNLRLGNVKYLLLTHPHSDHLYTSEFAHRDGVGHGRDLLTDNLEVVCPKSCEQAIRDTLAYMHARSTTVERFVFHSVEPFEEVVLGNYRVTALPARHIDRNNSYIYLITDEKEGKTVLHGNDTGYFYEDVFEYLEKCGRHLDFCEIDCTEYRISDKECRHAGYAVAKEIRERLIQSGAADEKTKFVLNHFSHNCYKPFTEMEKDAEAFGYTVSYDGMSVEI